MTNDPLFSDSVVGFLWGAGVATFLILLIGGLLANAEEEERLRRKRAALRRAGAPSPPSPPPTPLSAPDLGLIEVAVGLFVLGAFLRSVSNAARATPQRIEQGPGGALPRATMPLLPHGIPALRGNLNAARRTEHDEYLTPFTVELNEFGEVVNPGAPRRR